MSDYVRMPKADYQSIVNKIKNLLNMSSSTKIKSGDIVGDLESINKKIPTTAYINNVTQSGTYNSMDQTSATGSIPIKAGYNYHSIYLERYIEGESVVAEYVKAAMRYVRVSEDPNIISSGSSDTTITFTTSYPKTLTKRNIYPDNLGSGYVENGTAWGTKMINGSTVQILYDLDSEYVVIVPVGSALIPSSFPTAGVYIATKTFFGMIEFTNITLSWYTSNLTSLDSGKVVNNGNLVSQSALIDPYFIDGKPIDTTLYNSVLTNGLKASGATLGAIDSQFASRLRFVLDTETPNTNGYGWISYSFGGADFVVPLIYTLNDGLLRVNGGGVYGANKVICEIRYDSENNHFYWAIVYADTGSGWQDFTSMADQLITNITLYARVCQVTWYDFLQN